MQLVAWYSMIIFLILSLFGGVLYWHMRANLYQGTQRYLQFQMRIVVHKIEEYQPEKLDKELRETFGTAEDPFSFYCSVWNADGSEVLAQTGIRLDSDPPRNRRGYGWNYGQYEFVQDGPKGTFVSVGRDLKPELIANGKTLFLIFGLSALFLMLAVGGGLWITRRAFRPIDRMSHTAERISAKNLSERMDTSAIQNELGPLARTLNETFDRIQTSFERQIQFTANASHELRTPLSIFMSHVELALRKDRTPEEYRQTLEICLQAVQRMKAVVDGLLTLARTDSRELNLWKERVDLQPVLEETASILRSTADDRQVSLRVKAAPVHVLGDRERLCDVVSNLVTNAIRYNREGGTVDIVLEGDGREAILTVADTGTGIPEKDRPHIFERFYRVDKARSRVLGGSGLGLAIVKWIVEAHGGKISFTSQENVGTTFTVRLPIEKS